jgi:hypothetical protein
MTDTPLPSGSPAPAPGGASPPAWGACWWRAGRCRADAGPVAARSLLGPARSGIKRDFGKHYSEVATVHKTFTEQQAALAARKPEDIKIEVKLPETVKVPDGMESKIDPKDPRVDRMRAMALKNGWSQEQVNDLVAFDAQQKIAEHAAEQTRLTAEKQKLGANGDTRIKAAADWVKGFTTDPAELGEVQVLTATAAGVSLLEKLMAKANGSVPGTGGQPAPSEASRHPHRTALVRALTAEG